MTQQPDTAPGMYYVTVRRPKSGATGYDYVLLAGPFINDHAGALATVAAASKLANEYDARSHWYEFGTARFPYTQTAPGIFNKNLGLPY